MNERPLIPKLTDERDAPDGWAEGLDDDGARLTAVGEFLSKSLESYAPLNEPATAVWYVVAYVVHAFTGVPMPQHSERPTPIGPRHYGGDATNEEVDEDLNNGE